MYKHTQIGWLMLILLGVGIILTGYFGILYSNWIALLVFGVLIVCIVLFSVLTVIVNDNFIEVRFGPGVIGKKFRLDNYVPIMIEQRFEIWKRK